MYRPPDTSKHTTKHFTKIIDQKIQTARDENKELIIMGDLNCDYSNPTTHNDVKSMFRNNGFVQLVKNATRVTEHSSTLIVIILLFLQTVQRI